MSVVSDRRDNYLAVFCTFISPGDLIQCIHGLPGGVFPVQITFETSYSPREYADAGPDFPFPTLGLCPSCKQGKPHRHGFYWRFCLDGYRCLRIKIRRYYCRRCGITISLLPGFCVPRFQYTLDVIWKALLLHLDEDHSLRRCLRRLKNKFPLLDWHPHCVSFYAKRFQANLPWMETLLRCAFSRMKLDSGIKRRAKKVLATARYRFPRIQSFPKLFFEQCHRSFLAPTHF